MFFTTRHSGNTKMTAKTKIIQFLEAKGEQSTGKIEDFMRLEFGTLGGTTGRRLRELAHDGTIERVAKNFEGKKYFAYRVAEIKIAIIGTIDSRTEEVNQTNLKI